MFTVTIQLWHIIAFIISAMFATAVLTHRSYKYTQSLLHKITVAPFAIVGYPIYLIYRFFHLMVKGTSAEKFEKLQKVSTKPRKIIGKIYLWHDKEAQKFHNKFFLVRVKGA